MGFKNSLEWQLGSIRSEAIAFLTHASFLTGQRERYITVYPFAKMILKGKLQKDPLFSNFKENEVFIFCNYRPLKDCRPDLMAFSSKGDVFLVEGKQRRKDNEKGALATLRTGLTELKDYCNLLQKFCRQSKTAPYECWKSVYNNCYVKDEKHGFPDLGPFIAKATNIGSQKEITALFQKINTNILNGRILFGLAFNDEADEEPYFSLDEYDLMHSPIIDTEYKTNPKGGVKNLGYFEIENEKIINVVKKEWNKNLGKLCLFGINRSIKSFRALDPM